MKFKLAYGWAIFGKRTANNSMQLHVVPLNDDKEHRISARCSCSPFLDLEDDGGSCWVHSSFDGRHEYENHGRLYH